MRRSICLVATVGCAAVLLPAAGQEKPNKPEQFTQSVERPNRTWDYDGKRILGHVGEKICLWDATTGKLLRKLKGHKERIFAAPVQPRRPPCARAVPGWARARWSSTNPKTPAPFFGTWKPAATRRPSRTRSRESSVPMASAS